MLAGLPESGDYFSTFKIVLTLALVLPWLYASTWVNKDSVRVHMPQEFQVPRARPEIPGRDRGREGRLQIALRPLPARGHQHPTRWLVERQHQPVLIKDGDPGQVPLVPQFDVGRLCHVRPS